MEAILVGMGKRTIEIYQYLDHQEYLRAWFTHRCEDNASCSLQWLATRLHIRSKGYAHRILHDPAKTLSRPVQEHLVELLELSPAEAEYFRAMVAFAAARKPEDRAKCFTLMRRFLGVRESGRLLADRYDYLSCWWLPALREQAVSKDWKQDYLALGQSLQPALSESQVRKGVELLLRLGLLRKSSKGVLSQAEAVLRTDADVLDVAIYNYHKEQLERSLEALEMPVDQRELAGITFGVPTGSYTKMRERIREFQQSLLAEFGSLTDKPQEVLQVNLQMFYLTKPKGVKA